MNLLIPAIINTFLGSLVLVMVFGYLYHRERERYILTWTVSWAIYALRFLAILLAFWIGENILFFLVRHLASLVAGFLLLLGSYQFLKLRFNRWWWWILAVGSLWIILAVVTRTTILITTLPLYTFLAGVFIWSGIMFVRQDQFSPFGRYFVGIAFVLWGLHKADLPFLINAEWFLPWGFLLGGFFEFSVGIGVLLVFFDHMSQRQQTSERKFRDVFTKSPLPSYLWRQEADDFVLQDFNESADAYTQGQIREQIGKRASILYDRNAGLMAPYEQVVRERGVLELEITDPLAPPEVRPILLKRYSYIDPNLVLVQTEDITERKATEEDLLRREHFLRIVIDSIDDPLQFVDRDFRIRLYNAPVENWCQNLNLETDVAGRDIRKVWSFLGHQAWDALQQVLDLGVSCLTQEKTMIEGREIFTETRRIPVRSGTQILGVLTIVRDITEILQSAEKLEHSETRAHALLDAIPDLMFRQSRDGIYLDYKADRDQLYSQSVDTIIGKSMEDLLPAALVARFKDTIARTLENDEIQTMEYELDMPGGPRQYEARMVPSGADEITSIIRDITLRRKTKQELDETTQSLQETVKAANVGLWDWNLLTDAVHYSPEWKAQIGYRDDEIPNHFEEWKSRLHPDDLEGTLASIQEAISNRESNHRVEFRFRHRDGSYRWILAHASVHCDEKGNPDRMLGSHIDISERKQNEIALEKNEKRLSSIFRSAPVGIGTVIDRVITEVNERLIELTGYSKEELIGQSARILYPNQAEFERVGRVKYGRIAEAGTGTVETRWQRKNGEIRDILLSSTPIDPEDLSQGVTFTALDITRRNQALSNLEASEQEKNLILNATTEMVAYYNTDLRIIWANQAAANSVNRNRDEMIGLHCYSLWNEGDIPCEGCPVLAARDDGRPYETERQTSDGRYWRLRGYPVLDVDNQVMGLVEFGQDITDIKQIESESQSLQQQLIQSQKMEALGTMVGGIAHDFNNILQSMTLYMEIVQDELDPASRIYQDFQKVVAGSQRASDLVRQILTFSRMSKSAAVPVRVQDILTEALELINKRVPPSVELETQIETSVRPTLGDATQLHQVIVNLCHNALDAMESSGGILTVELREVQAQLQAEVENAKPGPVLRLQVGDTGRGMDAATREKIFDPFFTTKEVGAGTGLGLSVAFGIVDQMGGRIDVDSHPGQGTVFTVLLPLLGDEQSSVAPHPDVTQGEGHLQGLRILLADDEESILRSISKLLEGVGCRITAVRDGQEALEQFMAAPESFDLLITDYSMPRMMGSELVAAIRETGSRLPVILSTGVLEHDDSEHFKELGVDRLLMKPWTQHDLTQAIQDLCDPEEGDPEDQP